MRFDGDELPAEADHLAEVPDVAAHLFRALATRTSISPPSRSAFGCELDTLYPLGEAVDGLTFGFPGRMILLPSLTSLSTGSGPCVLM